MSNNIQLTDIKNVNNEIITSNNMITNLQQKKQNYQEKNNSLNNQMSPVANFTLPQRIPILYLWFGKTVPEDYLISLSELNYPVIFLKNPQIQRNFTRPIMDVELSDYYRLYYLYQHGGIYSDFDNTIDYNCLMNIIKPYRNQDKLVFMTDNKHTRAKTKQTTNNLIFAPYPKMPILKKMLDSIDQTKQKVWDFAGIKFVGKFSQPLEITMSKCIKHSYDWSWFQASNQVLGKNNKPHPKFAKKLQKKANIVLEKDKLQINYKVLENQIKMKENEVMNKNHQNFKLKQKIKQIYIQTTNKYPSLANSFIKKFPDLMLNKLTTSQITQIEEQQNLDKKQKQQSNNPSKEQLKPINLSKLQNKISSNEQKLQALKQNLQSQRLIQLQNKNDKLFNIVTLLSIILLLIFVKFVMTKIKSSKYDKISKKSSKNKQKSSHQRIQSQQI